MYEPPESEQAASTALRSVFFDSLKEIEKRGESLSKYGGRAPDRNTSVDDLFTQLESFQSAIEAVSVLAVRHFNEYVTAKRLVLQFIYNGLTRMGVGEGAQPAFDHTWNSLLGELAESYWTYIGIANLRNFTTDAALIELGDGITIRPRDLGALRSIFGHSSDLVIHNLLDDWGQGVGGSHVMVVEERVEKTPANAMFVNTPGTLTKAARALLALRLLQDGDISIGRLFFGRPSRFDMGIGFRSTGLSLLRPGTAYQLQAPDVPAARARHELLLRFDSAPSAENIALALGRFSAIYDRLQYVRGDGIVDAITALEALLRLDIELSFRAAFCTAGILANDDAERVQIFSLVRSYYKLRNKLVHGGSLKSAHYELLQNESALRNVLRRMLMAFLRLADAGGLTPKFYDELDEALQHEPKRRDLRASMGL